MSDLPFVTVAMPCLDEAHYIEDCLRCVQQQDYPRDRFEIFVADGGSTDGTLDILARLADRDGRIRVIANPGRIQAAGMNEVLRVSRGEVVVRLDVHGEYAQDYLRKCVEVLERTGADNAGGAQRPKFKGRFQQALCAALASPLGVGGSPYRSANNEGFVDTVFNGAFRRSVFDRAGLYDPRAITNEDAELNQRILQSGGRVYLSREIVAWYYPRDSLQGLARQYFNYGRGRARTLLKHRKLPTHRPLVPFVTLILGVILLATAGWHPFSLPAFLAYSLLCVAEAVRVGRAAVWWSVPLIAFLFPVMHVAHGLGMGVGLLRYARHPDWTQPESVPLSAALQWLPSDRFLKLAPPPVRRLLGQRREQRKRRRGDGSWDLGGEGRDCVQCRPGVRRCSR